MLGILIYCLYFLFFKVKPWSLPLSTDAYLLSYSAFGVGYYFPYCSDILCRIWGKVHLIISHFPKWTQLITTFLETTKSLLFKGLSLLTTPLFCPIYGILVVDTEFNDSEQPQRIFPWITEF